MKNFLILSTIVFVLSGCASRITCGEWNEIKTPDGKIYTERRCSNK